MRNDKPNVIVDKTVDFALKVIDFTEGLQTLKKYNMANQLFKSGTSIGANVWEAQNAESKADFVHKLKIAAKEADETVYWLTLSHKSMHYPDCQELLDDIHEIIKILSAIIGSSKKQ